ncbi:MAG: SDR family oxidoreductase [Blastococcus sp.]
MIGLTETLAIELGSDGIRVNAIAPGAVQGDRVQRVLRGRAGPGRRPQPGRRHRRRPEHPVAEMVRRSCGHRLAGAVPRLRQREVDHRADHPHRGPEVGAITLVGVRPGNATD